MSPFRLSLYRLPFRSAWVSRRGAPRERWSLVVHVANGDATGVGEAPLPLGVADGPGVAREAVATLARTLPDPGGEFEAALVDAPGWLRHGVVTALLDREARLSGAPFAEHLARRFNPDAALTGADRVPANGNVGPLEPGAAADAAVHLVESGFRAVKVKSLGRVDEDVARLRAIRAAIGDVVALRLDANGAWSPNAAITALHQFRPFGLEYVEQPVPPEGALAAAGGLARSGVPVAWDESVTDAGTATELARAGAAALVVKPPRIGGPDRVLAVLEAARAEAVPCVISSPIEGAVGRTVDLHLARLAASGVAHGLATGSVLEHDYAEPSPRAEGGFMAVPKGAGLGPVFRFTPSESRWEEKT